MRHRRPPAATRLVAPDPAARVDGSDRPASRQDASLPGAGTQRPRPADRATTDGSRSARDPADGRGGDESPDDAAETASAPRGTRSALGRTAGGTAYGSGRRSTSVDRDDVLRESRDRQVLVVGDGTVGRVLTGLLQRAGFDPVLASTHADSVEPAAGLVDAGAFDVLAAAGVAEDVRERGREVVAVRSTWPGDDGDDPASSVAPLPQDGARPVAIDTATIRRLVDAECGTARTAPERTVDAIVRVEDGVEVAFENGVREWFDVVVDVAGAGLSQGASPPCGETASLRQYETRLAPAPDARAELRDVWTDAGLVQCVPVRDATAALVRVTTPASDRSPGPPDAAVADHLPEDLAGLSTALADADATAVEQRRPDDDEPLPRSWGRGRVMRCGVAASPVAPASGLAVSRGIEDAGALATALTRSRDSVEATVAAYTADRERAIRTARLERSATDTSPGPPPSELATDGLRALATDRRIALAAIRHPTRSTD